MCIRDSAGTAPPRGAAALATEAAAAGAFEQPLEPGMFSCCLLYTSDAADERSSVDLGGRRIIKKKTNDRHSSIHMLYIDT